LILSRAVAKMSLFKRGAPKMRFCRPLCMCLLILIVTGCHEQPTPKMPPIVVTVVTAEEKEIPAVFEYIGVANSSHLVEIRARVEGFLDTIAYKEGLLVHENDLLFQIDPKPFEVALAQAKALEEQQAAFLWQAQRALDRFKPLYEKKAASLRDLDNATAQALSAQATLDAAKAQVMQAEINLGYTTVRSPITGLSNQAKYREGALVGPGSEQQSLLTTIYTVDPIWVDFNVSEGDILKSEVMSSQGKLRFPKDMNFVIEAVLANGDILPGKGHVDFADPAFQKNTGSMTVRAILPNPKSILKPGQFVRARLKGAIYPNAIAVPKRSVMQGKNGQFVYVVNKDSKVETRYVTPGDWYQDYWIIASGLTPGERVIVDGVNKVLPGMPVTVKSSEETSTEPTS